jgi:hypothetical protein
VRRPCGDFRQSRKSVLLGAKAFCRAVLLLHSNFFEFCDETARFVFSPVVSPIGTSVAYLDRTNETSYMHRRPESGAVRERKSAEVVSTEAILKAIGLIDQMPVAVQPGFNQPFRLWKQQAIRELERQYVEWILATFGRDITEAAKAAGLDRRALSRLVRKYSPPLE